MKICLYLEFHNICTGGVLSSFQNQKTILDSLNIPFNKKFDKSCDILQVNVPGPRTVYLMKKAKKQGKKVIIWSHTTVEDTKQLFKFVPFVTPVFKKHLTYVYGLADLIFAPSEYTKKLLIAYGLPHRKIVVLSNAVDLKKFHFDSAKRKSGRKKYKLNSLTIGSMGLVMPRKGVDKFLLLSQKFPDNQFIWFGKIFRSYSSPFIKRLPKTLPKNVKFTGFIKDANEAFNSLDIFLFPSFEENEGMAILEACAVGLPIIVRDIPTYKGWLIHGKNCLKAKNDKEFEKYLRKLIENENLRKKLGKNAKILAGDKSVQNLAKKTLLEYKKLIN
jgi:1,2-diacylglycerol-3-alpha-glucose alpha-1,2-glucosyltransferase